MIEIQLKYEDVANLVRELLLKKYTGKTLRDGWTVKDFEVLFNEEYASSGEEYDEGWTYSELNIYIVKEKLCGKKQILKTKKDRLYLD